MEVLLIAFVFVLNFAISWWNAYACGKSWAETKAAGGWNRFMCWMGAIMSASGFTWCYLTALALTAYYFQLLTMHEVTLALEMGYILIIPGVIFSGMMITVDSWARAYRQGGVLNYGIAGYNTYAQVHNTMSAIQTFGHAFGDVLDAFGTGKGSSRSSSSDDDGKGAAMLLLIVLVVLAASAGILTTTLIIKKVSASEPLPSIEELRERKRLADSSK